MGWRLKARKGANGRWHLCRKGKHLAKCGCDGGGPHGCCFCADDAETGDPPCLHFPPTCNKARKCCCGSRLTVTIAKHTHQRGPGLNDRYRDQIDVYDVAVHKQPNGSCAVSADLISASSHRYGVLPNGQPYDVLDNQQDVDIFNFVLHNRDRLCRCEPSLLLEALTESPGQAVVNAFAGEGQCSGTLGSTSWDSDGGCLFASFHFHAGAGGDDFYDESARVDLVTTEDNCCGKKVLSTGVPGANPPGFPGGPGGITDGGECPRCGGPWDGAKCRHCQHCDGCGG